jgi:hypothetical protein
MPPALGSIKLRHAALLLQVLLLVCALFHTSVYLVLSWTSAIPLLVEALAGAKLQGRALPESAKVPLGIALAGTLLELLFDSHRSLMGLLLLLLWSAVKCGEHVWHYLKGDPTAGGPHSPACTVCQAAV